MRTRNTATALLARRALRRPGRSPGCSDSRNPPRIVGAHNDGTVPRAKAGPFLAACGGLPLFGRPSWGRGRDLEMGVMFDLARAVVPRRAKRFLRQRHRRALFDRAMGKLEHP